MAVCSVRSSCVLYLVVVSMVVLSQAILCPVVREWWAAYLAKLGIQGIQDTRGIFWGLGGFPKIHTMRREAARRAYQNLVVCMQYEIWGQRFMEMLIFGGGGSVWGFRNIRWWIDVNIGKGLPWGLEGVRGGRGDRDSYWGVLRQTLDMLICRGWGPEAETGNFNIPGWGWPCWGLRTDIRDVNIVGSGVGDRD